MKRPRAGHAHPHPHPHANTVAKPPVSEVVECLEKLLERARRGELIAVGLGYVDDSYRVGSASGARPDALTMNLLKGAVCGDLPHELLHGMRGK